jgi:predicted RNA methylase
MPKVAAAILRAGERVGDSEFDRVYTPELRLMSVQHWTPVDVASRAARLLTDIGATRVLDIGAGPGKFCIVGSLTTSASFTGIEKRHSLVEAARMAALQFGANRARFVCANILDFDFTSFDGIYLYNPFYEQVGPDLLPIDDTIELSPELYRAYVVTTTAKLVLAPVGTAVVTYHGFGGVMPAQYHRVHREDIGSNELVLWVKERRHKRLLRRSHPPAGMNRISG